MPWVATPRNMRRLSTIRKGEKTALVSSNNLIFGYLRMFDILAENAEFEIDFHSFKDVDGAKKWLKEGDLS